EAYLFLFRDAAFIRIIVDDARERTTEACEMGAAIALGNVVREAENILVVAVIPPHGHFDADIILLGPDADRVLDERRLGAIKKADKSFKPAFIDKIDFLRLDAPQIRQADAHAGVEEGKLAQAVFQRREAEFGLRESLG